jgi:radical SAM superfamily enzyme YgiQ (UPF0313 family)
VASSVGALLPVLNLADRKIPRARPARQFRDLPPESARYDFTIFYPSFGRMNFGAGWRANAAEMAPLGPLYVAAPLIAVGLRVRFVDCNVERLRIDEFEHLVRSTRLFGLSFLTIQEKNAAALIEDIRRLRPDAWIVAGGHHCHLLQTPFAGADLTVTCEAEEIMELLFRAIERNQPLGEIPGLLFHDESGDSVRTPTFKSSTPLDRLPRPARELIDPHRYGFLFGARMTAKSAGVMSSRGCVFNCSFCIRSPYPEYRDRPAADVCDELAELARQGYDSVIMADEYFLTNRKRVAELMDLLVERGIRLRIIFQTRVNSVDAEIARKLKAGGVFAILFGIESGAADVLKFYNKGTTVERARKAVAATDAAGIFAYGGIILGAPIETRQHLEENIAFACGIPLDFVSFHHLVYMYGTPLWADAHRRGLIGPSDYWVDADERFGGASAAEIAEWRKIAFRRFYMRPRYWLRLVRKCIRMRSGFPFVVAWRFLLAAVKDGTRVGWVHDS